MRIFQGRYRSHTTQYVSIQLGHIPALVRFLLDHSFFSVGVQVFQQTRGASMGSQWAPILCSAVALQREFTFCELYGSVQSEWTLAHRYVDNRLLITPGQTFQTLTVQLFWNLLFYTPPIMLEAVEGDEALGFSISLPQRSITMILPWGRQEVRVRQAKS